MKILVYLDEGVDPTSFKQTWKSLKEEVDSSYSLVRVNHRHLIDTSWENDAIMLVIPGGRDTPYHEKLSGTGTDKIKNFVNNGGLYLGICAGAYFGCSAIEFEKGTPSETCCKRDLAFFPGLGVGSAYGSGVFKYNTHDDARAAKILWDTENLSLETWAYYNGGCFFADAENYDEVSVLARYGDIADNPPVVVLCRVGKGKAILCGAHPEYRIAAINKDKPDVKEKLSPHEEGSRLVFRSMLEFLGLKL